MDTGRARSIGLACKLHGDFDPLNDTLKMTKNTKFTLITRSVTADDASRECPHPAEDDVDLDLDLYLSSLAQDIENLVEIRSVSRSGVALYIEAKRPISQSELSLAIKPFFAGERFCAYRHVSLVAS